MKKIVFDNVLKRYNENVIFHHENFTLKDGLTFLVGKNGAGKTTLIRLSMGFESVTDGKIELFGRSVLKIDNEIKKRIGLQLQNESFLRNVKVGEYIQLYEALYSEREKMTGRAEEQRKDSGREKKKRIDIERIREILDIDKIFKRYAYTLSGGEKKKVSLYLTVIGNKDLIIVDEPTAGIDVEVKDRIVSVIMYLRECGVDILVSSHDLEEFYAIADNILMLNQRVVFDGTKKEFERNYNYPYRVCTERVVDESSIIEGKLFEKKYLYSRDRESLLKYFPLESIEKTTAKDLYQIALMS